MGSTLRLVTSKIAIAIVEREAIAREGLATLLTQEQDFKVVASVDDFGSAALLNSGADVILVDARVTAGDDAPVPLALAEIAGRAKIIATRVSPDHGHLGDLVRVGVTAFVLKDASFADLTSAIRAAASGAQVMPACLLDRKHGAESGSAFDLMTNREREIVLLIASGKSNKEIAAHSCISPHTAKAHVRSIMEKLAVHSRVQIAARASKERWAQRASHSLASVGSSAPL